MKIFTIANDNSDYTLLKSNGKDEVFRNPQQAAAKELLINRLADCRKRNAEETFLILCNDFDGTTFATLTKILETLGLANQSLILFGINGFEVGTLQRLKRRNLGFFRAVYGKSYWNVIGKLAVKN